MPNENNVWLVEGQLVYWRKNKNGSILPITMIMGIVVQKILDKSVLMLMLVRPPLAGLRQKTMGRWKERGVDDVAVDNHYLDAGEADENDDADENGDDDENGDGYGDAADDYEDEEEETRVRY